MNNTPKQSSLEETSRIAWIILRTIKNLQTGKYNIAAFLKGSKSKLISPFLSKPMYGGLIWLTIPTISDLIDQLEHQRLITKRFFHAFTYSFPILELTLSGQQTLDEQKPILLEIRKIIEPIVIGASEKKTLALHLEGKSAKEIMNERTIALSTVYTHFYRLITCHYLSHEDVISKEVIERISKEIPAFTSSQPSVKDIKQLLPDISYEEIRCTLAGLQQISES